MTKAEFRARKAEIELCTNLKELENLCRLYGPVKPIKKGMYNQALSEMAWARLSQWWVKEMYNTHTEFPQRYWANMGGSDP